jgi:hypothetical protein
MSGYPKGGYPDVIVALKLGIRYISGRRRGYWKRLRSLPFRLEASAMKRSSSIFFILFLLAGTISAAYADCIKDGVRYPEGAVVGGFICQNGQWVKR